MALDVYVGGFARYYAREWENVVQAWARQTGTAYKIIGPDGEPQPNDWDDVAEAVTHWQAAMNAGLAGHLSEPLTWDESRAAPYFTDRPTYDGYGALLLWASYAQLGRTPPREYSGEWFTDEAFAACSTPGPDQPYRAILTASLWLPGQFDFGFEGVDLAGEKAHIRSTGALHRALNELNAATFRLSPEELAEARRGDFGEQPTLEDWARFGLSTFHDLSGKAVQHGLPLVLSM